MRSIFVAAFMMCIQHFVYRVFSLLLIMAMFACPVSSKDKTANAVVLMYHHVSNQTPASTSITPHMFALHMDYLAKHHTVLPLQYVIQAIQQGKSLPSNTVVITFDDGYDNIAKNGHPILKEHGFSYTIFINPELIGVQPSQLSWKQINQMQSEGVSFANHSSVHTHLLTGSEQGKRSEWLARTLADIEHAEKLLLQKTGQSLKYVAYPYGEFNADLKDALLAKGYIGFGQHSGAISQVSDFSALPRVPAAGIYADLDTLSVKLNSLAMPVLQAAIKDPQRQHNARSPVQVLTLSLDDINPKQFSCYFTSEPISLSWSKNQVTLTLSQRLPVGRSRVNCTAPSIQQKGRYYWYSQPWFVPTAVGNWLD